MKRFVQHDEFITMYAADLFYRFYVLLVEPSYDIPHLTSFLSQLNTNRTAIDL